MKKTVEYKSGFVTVVGRPNVGKSTLINGLLGQKIAAVSPRPQTTRRRQLGILTLENVQIIFVDTPGMHKPVHKLGEFMNQEAAITLEDADVIVFLVDATVTPTDEDRMLAERIQVLRPTPAVILALNKVDQLSTPDENPHQREYQELVPQALPLPLSALTGFQRDRLLDEIIKRIPVGVPYYDEDQITDLYERDIAADLIREAALVHLRDEVPHGIAVRIDEYTERGETGAHIVATLFVERDSHKPILIGQGGEMIKRIGSTARKEIEKMSERKVYLELRVKVNKNWRDDDNALRLLGFHREEE
jgi:GTP-binding protein Era